MKTSAYLLAFIAISLFSGCASAPNTALEAARAKIQLAEEAEANLYLAATFQAAMDSITAAEAEIETQQINSPWSRDYAYASQLIQSASNLAEESIQGVDEAKETMENETAELLVDADMELDVLKSLIATTMASKQQPVMMVSFEENSGTIGTLLDEARTAYEDGHIYQANQLVHEAIHKTTTATEELNAAIAALTPTRGL